jgi:hypothetical protein
VNDTELVENFDKLPDDMLVGPTVASTVLANIAEQHLRRDPPIPKVKISDRRWGFRVGDLRELIRGSVKPAA